MSEYTAANTGFLIGVVVTALVAMFIGAVIMHDTKAKWCQRIKNSSMPVTFAECVPDNTEVPKNVKQN